MAEIGPVVATTAEFSTRGEDVVEEVMGGAEDVLEDIMGAQMEDEEIVNTVRVLLKNADDARKPRVAVWDEAWRLFNNNYDFAGKADWQSKNYVPNLTMAIEFAAALLKRSIVESRRFYQIEATKKEDEEYANLLTRLLDFWLDEEDFIERFSTAIKSGLITGFMPIKIWWKLWHQREPMLTDDGEIGFQQAPREALKIDFPSPYDVWLDPTGRNQFVIERIRMDLYQVRALMEEGFFSKKGYDALARQATEASPDRGEASRKRQDTPEAPAGRKTVVLWQYWGDLVNKEGKLSGENIWAIVGAADSPDAVPMHLLRAPEPNPFWHGKPPYVLGGPFTVPFATYHRGLLEPALGLQRMLTELGNLILDANLYGSVKAFEVDTTMVVEPSQFKGGITPGKMFKRRGGMPGQKMIDEIKVGGVDAMSVNIFSLIERQLQNSTGITEFLTGAPSSRGRPTATEVVTGRAQATSLVDQIARGLEHQVMEPLLEMSYQVLLQHMGDFSDPRLNEVLEERGQEIAELTNPERFSLLQGTFKFQARGMSVILSKAQELLKIMQFMQLTSANPTLAGRVNWNELLNRAVEAFGWDPIEVLVPKEQVAAQQQEIAQLLGQAGQGGGGGGAGVPGPDMGEMQGGGEANPDLQGGTSGEVPIGGEGEEAARVVRQAMAQVQGGQ